MLDTRALGYAYDRYVGPDGREQSATTTTSTMTAESSTSIAAVPLTADAEPIGRSPERVASGRPLELGPRAARTVLAVEGGRPTTAIDPTGQRRTYLIVKDLHTWAQPEVLYHLYVVARGAGMRREQYVGAISSSMPSSTITATASSTKRSATTSTASTSPSNCASSHARTRCGRGCLSNRS